MFGPGNLPVTLLLQPLDSVEADQPGVEMRMQVVEVLDVVGRVLSLRDRQRTSQPVGTGFAFGQCDIADLLYQALIAHRESVSQQGGGDLSVEQRLRYLTGHLPNELEILAGRVQDFHYLWITGQSSKGREVADGQWIGEPAPVAVPELQQGGTRKECAGPLELGIDRHCPASRQCRTDCAEPVGILNEFCLGRNRLIKHDILAASDV